MKKLFLSMKRLLARFRSSRALKRRCRLVEESNRRIQIMEFGGVIHICFDGVPLIEAGWLKDNVPLTAHLEEVRSTYQLWWQDKFECE